MRRLSVLFLLLCAMLALLFALTSCAKEAPSKVQHLSAKFPHKTVIDGYKVRFVPEKLSYPESLPTLSAKKENLTNKQILAWFKPDKIEKNPKITYPYTYSPFQDEQSFYRKSWGITGPETGVVSIDDYDVIRFQSCIKLDSGVFVETVHELPVVIPGNESTETLEKEAISKATQYLKAHGGIPEDVAGKWVVYGQYTSENGKSVPVGPPSGVHFSRKFNGVLVYPDEITVSTDKLGVYRYDRAWHSLADKSESKNLISPGKAAEAAVRKLAPRIKSRYGVVVSHIQLIYYNPRQTSGNKKSGEFRPGWLVRVTGSPVIIDAYTGKLQ